MVISYNTQLGLRFSDKSIKLKCLDLLEEETNKFVQNKEDFLKDKLEEVRNIIDSLEGLPECSIEEYKGENKSKIEDILNENIYFNKNQYQVFKKVIASFDENYYYNIISNNDGKYFLICNSVYKAAELIKVSSGFTGRTLKDIEFGIYTYLLGKNKMIRFEVVYNAIRGFYFDDKEMKCFEWGIEMEEGNFFFYEQFEKEFTEIMRILTFVELGDIETIVLNAGRNNGGKKNIDKITNISNNTVYVVDSSWNKLIIRTDGFAVRGHFRLQPCGESMKDRRLIWIYAFEKHGYKRSPKAEIVR